MAAGIPQVRWTPVVAFRRRVLRIEECLQAGVPASIARGKQIARRECRAIMEVDFLSGFITQEHFHIDLGSKDDAFLLHRGLDQRLPDPLHSRAVCRLVQ